MAIKIFCFLLLLAQLLAGCCARKELFVLLPDPESGETGEISIATEKGAIRLNQPRASAQVAADQKPEQATMLSEQEIQSIFAPALESLPQGEEKYLLYFLSEKTDLAPASAKQLPLIVRKIKKRMPCEISVVGYADTLASETYNLALSLRRAEKIKQELVAAGIPAAAIAVSGMGESNLLVPTADNVIAQKNRRAEISVR